MSFSTDRLDRHPSASLRATLAGWVLCFAVAWSATAADAQTPRASLELEPSGDIGIKEYVRLVVRIESPPRDVGVPTFELDNLAVVQGPSSSNSVQFVNGVSSHTLSLTWILQPKGLGPARVRSARVEIDGQTIELPDANRSIVADPPPRRPARRDPFGSSLFERDPFDPFSDRPRRRQRREAPPPEIFLRAEVTPQRPHAGEQVLYTLYLYTDVNVRSVTPTQLPDFKGFWTQVIPQPEDARPEMVPHTDGREIGRVVLLQRALFPRRAGRLEIEPVAANMAAVIRDSSLFGSLIPRMGELERTSNAVTVDVQPLPEPKPEGFQGLVGRFDVEATLEPTTLERGEAATLTLTLRGEGHLQGAQTPGLATPEGVEVFPPQETSDSSLRGTRVRGRRTWSHVLVPQRPGTVELTPIELPYFDPRSDTYQIARVELPPLEVRGTTRLSPATGGDVELHGIRETALPAPDTDTALDTWRHPLILGPLGLIALWLWRGRGASSSTSKRGARQRLLDALREAAKQERPRRAAAAAEEAWRTYLGERWDIAPGTPSTRWARDLVDRGVSPNVADDLVQLADDLHYLRYAPKLSSTENLRDELVERSKRMVKSL